MQDVEEDAGKNLSGQAPLKFALLKYYIMQKSTIGKAGKT
jgi:hypothetical protein